MQDSDPLQYPSVLLPHLQLLNLIPLDPTPPGHMYLCGHASLLEAGLQETLTHLLSQDMSISVLRNLCNLNLRVFILV